MHKRVRLVAAIMSSLVLSACANLSVGNLFSHYSAQNSELHQALTAGRYEQAQELLSDSMAGDILDNFEKGRIYLLNQQYSESLSAFELSDDAVRRQQDQATVSVSETAMSISALAVNDNLKTYQPADYELGFLHLYLGLNYLSDNDLEGALVEMRRANQVQEQARKDRVRELESVQQQVQAQGVAPSLGSVLANYPDAGETLQAIQNGYLLYLSALLYEADNDLNSAYVDYRRALAVIPDNLQVSDGTKRVAKRLAMTEDLAKLEQRYGNASYLASDKGRVVVLDERGVVEAMKGWNLTLPISRGSNYGLYSVALPYYANGSTPQFSSVSLNGNRIEGNLLTDVNLMAKQNLTERMPSIVIRQALRVWAKEELRREATKNNPDDIGNALFNVWNTLTEQPDTRSWLTLPGEIYSASAIVEPGEQSIQVEGQNHKFMVEPGRTTLVWLSRQGNNATIWHKQLGNIR
ncbi:lipoprotein [Vibrio galatheae]|uniref:Lipoprotein n=1 Tax=Vibrio galatheae TaxID=579748 RepID=A0A0F4NN69_9VIBR|nr:lipoprotein [Vibrio galatheae]KJY83526.1 lipoprotein [Vibrio galatheae]